MKQDFLYAVPLKKYSSRTANEIEENILVNPSSSLFAERVSILTHLYRSDRTFHVLGVVAHYTCFLVTISSVWQLCSDHKKFNELLEIYIPTLDGLYPHGLGLLLFYHLWAFIELALLNYFVPEKWLYFSFSQVPIALIMAALPPYIAVTCKVGVLIRFILVIEQMRIAMKVWSLVAENYKQKKKERATFTELLYFLFAPTLVFRKKYPRNKKRNYLAIIVYFLKGFSVVTFTMRLTVLTAYPFVQEVATGKIALISWWFPFPMLAIFSLIPFMMWYFFFQIWSNFWAELLCFADRKFYFEFWTVEDYAKTITGVNRIVHIFIKIYIYQPILEKFNQPFVAYVVVLSLSALLHDYVCAVALKLFLPVWVLILLPALIAAIFGLNLARTKCHPLVIPIFQASVSASQLLFLGLEYLAREHCHLPSDDYWIRFLTPHVLFCDVRFF